MASMSYCEFQNALDDFASGVEDIEMGEKSFSEAEYNAALEIIQMAERLELVIEGWKDQDDEDE